MTKNYTTEAIEPISSTSKVNFHQDVECAPLSPTPIRPFSSDVLSLSKAHPPSAISSGRPKLSPPTLSEYRYLHAMEGVRECSKAHNNISIQRMNALHKDIENLGQDRIEKITENLEKAKKSESWDTMQKVATALHSTISLSLGIAIASGGGSAVAGGALVASGVLALGNFACTNSSVWEKVSRYLAQEDEERKKTIGWLLPSLVGTATAALGIYGAAMSGGYVPSYLIEHVLSLLGGSVTAVQGVTNIGQGIAHGKLLHAQADMLDVRNALKEKRIDLQTLTQALEEHYMQIKEINARAGKMTRNIIQANLKIVQA